jgi:hypothetical protein
MLVCQQQGLRLQLLVTAKTLQHLISALRGMQLMMYTVSGQPAIDSLSACTIYAASCAVQEKQATQETLHRMFIRAAMGAQPSTLYHC